MPRDRSRPDWVLRSYDVRWLVREPPGYVWPASEGRTHVLESEAPGWTVRAFFTELPGHPGLVRLRSTNWRAEHEPSGFLPIAEARRLWRRLVAEGMAWTRSVLPGA